MSATNYQEPTELKSQNGHPRDYLIDMNEAEHIYTIAGCKRKPVSVTTVTGNYFSKFDADAVIRGIRRSRSSKNRHYQAMTDDEIKEQWANNSKRACTLGTDMHRAIEIYYNEQASTTGWRYPRELWLLEARAKPNYQQFLDYDQDFRRAHPDFRPYRTEMKVFDEHRGIAGTIDMLYINDKDELIMVDWKSTKNIRSASDRRGYPPFHTWDDCEFSKYTIQLNLYRGILEEYYQFPRKLKVKYMYIAQFHAPDELKKGEVVPKYNLIRINPVDLSRLAPAPLSH